MVDDSVKEAMLEKIESGSFGIADIGEYMKLFAEVANESEDVEEKLEDWDRVFCFSMEGADDFGMKVEEAKITIIAKPEESDVELTMSGDTAAGIFTGEIDATSAYMSGDLKITGPLPDAVKFRTITELVREELED